MKLSELTFAFAFHPFYWHLAGGIRYAVRTDYTSTRVGFDFGPFTGYVQW